MGNTNMSELKKRALLAKQRMRMGYWQAITEERERHIEELGQGLRSAQLVKDLQLAKIERDDRLAFGSSRAIAEEQLYQKVCQMLDENELVSNPIGKLVDRTLYESMDEGNRQKYILDLSNKFRQLKERYYQEKRLENSERA